jgi:hypothetical protein
MKEFQFTYNFEKNNILFKAIVSGNIYDKSIESNDTLHEVTDLIDYFKMKMINSITCELSDDKQNLFINGELIINKNIELLQSNANDSYYILIDNDYYPISINIETIVKTNPFELLNK